MSYYLTAHRHGNRINIPVEEKHKYITDRVIPSDSGTDIAGYSQKISSSATFLQNIFNIYKTNYSSYINSDGTSKSRYEGIDGLNMSSSSEPRLFYRPQQLYIAQGTGARERIGDKVYVKRVQIMLNLSLLDSARRLLSGNGNQIVNQIPVIQPVSYTTATGGGTIVSTSNQYDQYVNHNYRANQKQWYKFRIMIVRFNDLLDEQKENETDLRNYLKDWWNKIWVPQAICTTDDDDYVDIPIVSNQSKMLRESTEYNGKYQIMYDQVIELNQADTSKHIEINLEPKKNLTFGTDLHPTSEDWNNVYGFIIPPLYYKTDMDLVSYQTLQDGSDVSVALAEYSTNVKFTYYDI